MADLHPYGGGAAARKNTRCECGHPADCHEGDMFGFCLACTCNHYAPIIRYVTDWKADDE